MMEWAKDKDCAMCNMRLKSHYRIYFKHKKMVTTCMECYHRLTDAIENAKAKCIEDLFHEQKRSFAIESSEY